MCREAVLALGALREAPALRTLHLRMEDCSLRTGLAQPFSQLKYSTSLTDLHLNLRHNQLGEEDLWALSTLRETPLLKVALLRLCRFLLWVCRRWNEGLLRRMGVRFVAWGSFRGVHKHRNSTAVSLFGNLSSSAPTQ